MKKLLLSLALVLGLSTVAQAQCVSVGGATGPAPLPGISCASEPTVATYAASSIGLVPAASATDIACIAGSATKVIRVQQIKISGSAGTLVNVPVSIRKNASADTGGTLATTTALPVAYSMDSNTATNPTATATLAAYTGNPTIPDSAPGLIDTGVVVLTATGTLAGNTGRDFDYRERNFSQAPTLRGVAQQICVNLNATSITSGVVNVTFQWTEQAQ
jgi:hypothetical protein